MPLRTLTAWRSARRSPGKRCASYSTPSIDTPGVAAPLLSAALLGIAHRNENVSASCRLR